MSRRSNRSDVRRSSFPSYSVLRSVPRPVVRVFEVPVRRLPSPVFGDRRIFNPSGLLRPVVSSVRAARRLVPARKASPSRVMSLAARIGFAVPRQVSICVRRKQRKETLFALKLTSRGAGSRKRRNIWSEVSC